MPALACRWRPRRLSFLGCVLGGLDCLGSAADEGWLYGGCGYAFAMNVHENLCPSGPTAWDTRPTLALGRNVGFDLRGVFAVADADSLDATRVASWNLVREAIDEGSPCVAWNLAEPEHYLVHGYDRRGYLFSGPGCDEGDGWLAWRRLGANQTGIVEAGRLSIHPPADDATTVREAFRFAVEHAHGRRPVGREHYRIGLGAYTAWIAALESGRASDAGARYNAGVWLECRRNAVSFLSRARLRLATASGPGSSSCLDDAIVHYTAVAENLASVAQVYPVHGSVPREDPVTVGEKSRSAIDSLRKARAAETAAIADLERALAVL